MKKKLNNIKANIKSDTKFASIKGGTGIIDPNLSVNDWACSNEKDCSTSTNLKRCQNFQICRS